MSDDYQKLLAATIDHLEILKTRGTTFVTIDSATMTALNDPKRNLPAVGRNEPINPEPIKFFPPETAVRAVLESVELDSPRPIAPSQSPGKSEAMNQLRERAMVCVKCPNLASSRQNVVFGIGDIDSPLIFVGEAPGADEDAQGEPFVGKAGELLSKIIKAMGLSRASVYIANVLKCRPDTPGQTTGNRKPTTAEMKTCLPYLLEQIDIIKPKVIVALGATAVEGLFGKPMPITKLRGNWQTFNGTPVMPTFHPSYLLHNQALSEKRKVWEDMLQVMEKLEAPISEKQRNYFLKA